MSETHTHTLPVHCSLQSMPLLFLIRIDYCSISKANVGTSGPGWPTVMGLICCCVKEGEKGGLATGRTGLVVLLVHTLDGVVAQLLLG